MRLVCRSKLTSDISNVSAQASGSFIELRRNPRLAALRLRNRRRCATDRAPKFSRPTRPAASLTHDQPDRYAIASQLMRYRDGRGDDWGDIIDMLTMHPDARRRVLRVLGELDALIDNGAAAGYADTRTPAPVVGAGASSDSVTVRAAGVLPPGHRGPRSSWFAAPGVRSSGPSRRSRPLWSGRHRRRSPP